MNEVLSVSATFEVALVNDRGDGPYTNTNISTNIPANHCDGTCHSTHATSASPANGNSALQQTACSVSLSAPLRLYVPPVPQKRYCPVIPKSQHRQKKECFQE